MERVNFTALAPYAEQRLVIELMTAAVGSLLEQWPVSPQCVHRRLLEIYQTGMTARTPLDVERAITGLSKTPIRRERASKNQPIRQWGRENGFAVGDRGRFSSALLSAYAGRDS